MALFVDAFSKERGIVPLDTAARKALASFPVKSHTDLNSDPNIQQFLMKRVKTSIDSTLGSGFKVQFSNKPRNNINLVNNLLDINLPQNPLHIPWKFGIECWSSFETQKAYNIKKLNKDEALAFINNGSLPHDPKNRVSVLGKLIAGKGENDEIISFTLCAGNLAFVLDMDTIDSLCNSNRQLFYDENRFRNDSAKVDNPGNKVGSKTGAARVYKLRVVDGDFAICNFKNCITGEKQLPVRKMTRLDFKNPYDTTGDGKIYFNNRFNIISPEKSILSDGICFLYPF
jgi:hypothetical protein